MTHAQKHITALVPLAKLGNTYTFANPHTNSLKRIDRAELALYGLTDWADAHFINADGKQPSDA